MFKKEPTYKEKNGTTRVGDFLRKISKKETLQKIFGVGSEIVNGDIFGAIEKILIDSTELSDKEKQEAIILLNYDLQESKEVTKRWQSDNKTDSWLAKNIRPIVLAFLMLTLFIYIILDSSMQSFTIAKEWINLLSTNLSIVIVAYFGGRSYEKIKNKI